MSLPVPPEWHILVVRTDFSDDDAWRAVCDLIAAAECEGYAPSIVLVEDRGFDGASVADLAQLADPAGPAYIFVVDSRTLADSEHPVIVVDLDVVYGQVGRVFRTIPAEVAGIEANLSIANMDFEEFAEATDGDGVFRGFTQ